MTISLINFDKYNINLKTFDFRCNNTESRTAAYDLLIELANQSLANLKDVSRQLLEMHHHPNRDAASEWEVSTLLLYH